MKPEEFKKIRRDMKLTQQELAAILGVSSRQLQRWEGGFTPIPRVVDMALTWLKEGKRAKK